MATLLIFIWIAIAMVAAGIWEASVEGKNFWDKGKTGWKIKVKKYTLLTRYHFWLFFVMFPMLITLPLIISGFDLKLLGVIISAYCIGIIIEDFTWFCVNPYHSLKKWNPKHVKWYPWLKLGPINIPVYYLLATCLSIASWFFLWR